VKAQLRKFGRSHSPVAVIDDFTGDSEAVALLADALAPFPPETGNDYYPGLRRVITPADGAAEQRMRAMCRTAAPFIANAFDITGFDLLQASFSIVTKPPESLQPRQRFPHYDSPDGNNLALLLYLRVGPGTGTAFYRQRATGIERITEDNRVNFVRVADAAIRHSGAAGYIIASDDDYEQIGAVEAVPDRMIIYPTNLLHSGIIPHGMTFSADPREGRLTANLFVRGRKSA